jgi:hypothetical protein
MYTQRAVRPPQSFRVRDLWRPVLPLEDGTKLRVQPRPSDRYVVVDEIIEGRLRLVVAPWPEVDGNGRLRFSDLGSILRRSISTDRLQKILDARRKRHHQTLRNLRVSDAFLVRRFAPNPADWGYVVDVSRASRLAARFAQLRALIPTGVVPRDRGKRKAPPREVADQTAQRPQRLPSDIAPARY